MKGHGQQASPIQDVSNRTIRRTQRDSNAQVIPLNRVLIAGAGAEVDLGFRSGPSFTQDTFYRQKVILYDALANFYQNRLGSARSELIPMSYKKVFLSNPRGEAFKKLVSNLVKDAPDYLSNVLKKPFGTDSNDVGLTDVDYEILYRELIIESDDTDAVRRQSMALKSIPDDAHFGILEQYYSALINPNRHSIRFWKLVNFYWSAFFSIALPITDGLYGKIDSYNKNRYAYVLEHLDDTVHTMFGSDHVTQKTSANCYYSALRDKFDMVITTNYTPYAASIVSCDDSRIAWLAGRLSQFEHLPGLEYVDYSSSGKTLEGDVFVFPYLLCQSPVKPIISIAQIDEFARAADVLRATDEIVVLGYSFCNEDAHINSMVGEALRSGKPNKLVFFRYTPKDETSFDQSEALSELARKLRIPKSLAKEKVVLEPISDCGSKNFLDYCSAWG